MDWDSAVALIEAAEQQKPKRSIAPPVRSLPVIPAGTMAFDIETDSAAVIWRTGPEYFRILGYGNDDGVTFSTDPEAFVQMVVDGDGWIVGHNSMGFDLIVMSRHFGLDILQLARQERAVDTKLLAFLDNPPPARTKQGEIEKRYSLEASGQKYLGTGKMEGGAVLKRLAKEYGGFGNIPTGNAEYREYLRQDVNVSWGLVKVLGQNDYSIREHKIAAIAAEISIAGFRVDLDLVKTRIKEGEAKRLKILTALQEYGLPGPDEAKAPQSTKRGKEAIDTAFGELGVTLPRNPSGTGPALGKEALDALELEGEALELAEAVKSLNGIRTVYQSVEDNLVGDRVHCDISLRQASGRLSFQNPGLTTMGKKNGKYIEREMFLADEGDVLIALDLSQVDARAVAALCQDPDYMDLFAPGRDLHTEMAVKVGVSREVAKILNHALNYGMGVGKLSRTAGISEDEAFDILLEIKEAFPYLEEWKQEVREEGEGGVLWNGFGRKLTIEPDRSWTQSPALMGQSTARDLMCEGILNLWKAGGDGLIRKLRGVIHDEIILSVKPEDADEIGRLAASCLSFEWAPEGASRKIMIEAQWDGRTSATWGGLYS